jgi:hypothetical protein
MTTDDLITQSQDTFANAMTLLAVAIDPKATADRLKSIQASIAELRKAEAAAKRAKVAQAARGAELDAREAKLAAEKEALATREAEVDAKYETENRASVMAGEQVPGRRVRISCVQR